MSININSQLQKKILICLLVSTMFFSCFIPKKADAFVPFVIAGGLAIGEALFYTAAVGATGYAIYDVSKDMIDNINLAMPTLKRGWQSLSASAKEAWSNMEVAAVNTGTAVVLTAQMWMDTLRAGLLSITGTGAVVPAYDFPGANFNYNFDIRNDVFTPEWVARYSPITFTMNSSVFALIPSRISKEGAMQNGIFGAIVYDWALKQSNGTYTLNYTMPGDATAFTRMILVTSAGTTFARGGGPYQLEGSYISNGYAYDSVSQRTIVGLGFNYKNWNEALIGWKDAVVAMKLYLQTVYGGTAVFAPAIPGIPAIPRERDITKPVAIPVPPGAITYPKTGEGALTLTPEMVKTMTGAMTGAGTVNPPITPPLDWDSTPSTKLNFEPLKMTGVLFTKTFPFSIPWDLFNQLKIFDVAPKSPKYKVDIPEFFKFGGYTMPMRFDIDLSTFDMIAVAIRWIGTIAFDVGIILSMRRIMPE